MTAFIAIALIVFLGAALLVLLSGIALYARLIQLRTAVTSARSEVDNAIKKRDDPEPNPLPGELQDNIAAAVSDYNAAVSNYNSAVGAFPAQIIAKLLRLEKSEFFDMKLS